MGNLTLNGATSGQITLAPTAVAGTNTLTLPAKTGNIITSADTGTVSQTMLATGVAGNGPAFSAYNSGLQSLSASTQTKVTFGTEEYDTANCFDSTTNYRFTPNVAGYYWLTTQIRNNSASAVTNWWIEWRKNGSLYYRADETNSFGTVSSMVQMGSSRLIYLNGSTDYVEIYAWLASAGNIGNASFEYSNTFQGFLARAA